MKTVTKVFLILIILSYILLLFTNVSNAINMELDDPYDESSNPISLENSDGDTNSDDETVINSRPVSTVDQTNKDFFTPENILNMFLITVGIVLILLAIAILVRLKN